MEPLIVEQEFAPGLQDNGLTALDTNEKKFKKGYFLMTMNEKM